MESFTVDLIRSGLICSRLFILFPFRGCSSDQSHSPLSSPAQLISFRHPNPFRGKDIRSFLIFKMKTFVLGSLLLSAGVSALVARDGTCCFGINASGSGASGTVGQLTDGQTRVGGSGLNAGTFCIDTNGGITDGQGRGCIITTETTQFQCDDVTTTPTLGFSVGSNGLVAHNGSTTFYICETGGNGENIYIQTGPDVTGCTSTTLTADNCKNAASSCAVQSSSSPASSAPASAKPAVSSAASSIAQASSAVVVSPPTASAVVSSAPAQASSPPAEVSTSAVASSVPAIASSAPAQASYSPATVLTVAVATSEVVSSVKPSSPAVSSPVASPSSVLTATHTVVPVPVATSASFSVVTSVKATVATSSISAPSSPAAQESSTSQAATSVKPSSVPTTSQLPTTSTIPRYTNSSAPATQTSTQTSSTTGSCPTTVNTAATYQYPHLIVPVSSTSPNTAYGTGYNGIVNSTVSTIFNFDIPSSYSGKTCSLVFLFPLQSQLETSSYTFSGNGAIDFKELSSVATQ